MNDLRRCPDCGHPNPPGATACEACNFPLTDAVGAGAAPPAPAEGGPGEPDHRASPGGAPPPMMLRAMRPIRPRRPRPPGNQMATTLWLLFGTMCAIIVIFTAIRGYHENNTAVVEGSSENQQQRADSLRTVLARDSTNVDAHIALADVLYDTGNWSDAIVHYRAALARDSSRATTFVDLGVCYYNLSDSQQAEKLFKLALQRDPHQPVALFNLGIVAQRRGDHQAALQYFHRSMETSPPDEMRQPLMEAMQKSMDALGKKAPPIPEAGNR
jgi:hypothetical protein